jgi:polyferredoxin
MNYIKLLQSLCRSMLVVLYLFYFTGVFFFVFSYLREQACIVVCPYGRLQGVLLDRNSIIVAYDYMRGEEACKI